MAEVLLFHHSLGQTEGFHAFADQVRQAGRTVHTPDLYRGLTFASIQEGMSHAEEIGFGEIITRGKDAAEGLPKGLVYGGFSLGVLPAQNLCSDPPGRSRRSALLLLRPRVGVRSLAGRRPRAGARHGI